MLTAGDTVSGGLVAGLKPTGLGSRLGGLPFVVCAMTAYGFAHSALRMGMSGNIAQDDVIANVFAQTLEWGYTTRQPPLYDWLLWTVQQWTGPNLSGFLVLKYLLLTATVSFVYFIALRIMGDRKWSAAAALSLTLLYQIGWNIHEGVTHTITLMLAIAASYLAFIAVVDKGRLRDYAAMGLAVAAGCLSKFGYLAFMALLLVSVLFQPAIRARLSLSRLCITGAIAVVLVSPYAYWVVNHAHAVGAQFAGEVAGEGGRALRTARGMGLALYAPLGFLLPLLALLPALYPNMLPRLRTATADMFGTSEKPDFERQLFHMTLLGVAFLMGGAILFGASHYLERYMHALFLLTPVWLLTVTRRAAGAGAMPARILAAVMVLAIAGIGVRAANLALASEPFCRKCRESTPYAGLARELANRGLSHAVFITGYRHTAGNLRTYFPQASYIVLRGPSYAPPGVLVSGSRQVVVIWDVATEGEGVPIGTREALQKLGFEAGAAPDSLRIPWPHSSRSKVFRTSHWKLIVARKANR